MIEVYCFYHRADMDGHCSAAIVREWCRQMGHVFVPVGVNYGDRVEWLEGAGPEAVAVICDFTPEGDDPYATLDGIEKAYGRGLVWIDHHKTALDKAGPRSCLFAGSRTEGTAACVLTWLIFFPGRDVPKAVRLLGSYDVSDRGDPVKWEDEILPFQYGMRLYATDPGSLSAPDPWGGLLGDDTRLAGNIIGKGKTCLQFERAGNRRTALAAGYDCVFEGLFCCAANARGNSLALEAYARPEHKLRALWGFTGGRWRVSLYENGHADVDCGALAARRGGGGHRGAAGFEMPADLSPLIFFAPCEEVAGYAGVNACRTTGAGVNACHTTGAGVDACHTTGGAA